MKYRVVIAGAGRIGAGFNWHDLEYTHAGAVRANSDRAELIGFVEPDEERATSASRKWGVPSYRTIDSRFGSPKPEDYDIVCIATQPWDQQEIIRYMDTVQAIYCDKPYWADPSTRIPIQTNYIRRADPDHRRIAQEVHDGKSHVNVLDVRGKMDYHTWPHFVDLAQWWRAETLIYRPYNGPCSYTIIGHETREFPNGGVDGGKCMKALFGNLLDHLDNGAPLWSPVNE